MGLYRRGKIWWFRITHQGKRIQDSLKTDNKRLADKCYAKILTDIVEGGYFEKLEAKRHTFDQLKERYMTEHSMVNKTEKSSVRDECSFKHLLGSFSGMTLAEITPARISEYKSLRRSKGAKTATIARELEVMRNAFNLAVREWEWMARTPFEKVRIEQPNNKVERWLTAEEEQSLLEASLPWLRDIIVFALHSGMRQNEILTLKWTQVDLQRRVATLLVTKNKEKRSIPLNRTLLELLQRIGRVRSISGYVFVSEAGTRRDARNLLRAYYSARKAAALEDVRFHDLRHTFATRLVQAGIDLYKVKELLGHKSITMTMRYAHHYPESLRSSVEILDLCYNSATVGQKKEVRESDSSSNPLKLSRKLVAGTGFEPATFGL